MRDSAFKQIVIGIVVTVLGGLIVWWITMQPQTAPATPPSSSGGSTSTTPTNPQPSPQSSGPVTADKPAATPAWVGFANEIGATDRDPELTSRCGNFRRVNVSPEWGNTFIGLCKSVGRSCEKVCDWEGRAFPCSAISLGGKRDASRISLCR